MRTRHLFIGLVVAIVASLLVVACAPATPAPPAPTAVSSATESPLKGTGRVTVFSWGGSTTEQLHKYIYRPFIAETGIEVLDATADFAEPQTKAMVQAKNVTWDISSCQGMLYPSMLAAGMFEKIDYSVWRPEDLQAVPAGARKEYAVQSIQSSMVLAYDKRVFPEGTPHPTTWAEFWDVKKFPQKRAMYAGDARQPVIAALKSLGTPNDQIWPLTDDKLKQAFARLDEIKPSVTKWWTSGGEAPQLLINGEVAMTMAFDGRALTAINQGAPIGIEWDGAPTNRTYFVIPKGAPNLQNAQKFLAFVMRPEMQAEWFKALYYPGPNPNALKYLDASFVKVTAINPDNNAKLVWEDSDWYGANDPATGKVRSDLVNQKFLEWKVGAGLK